MRFSAFAKILPEGQNDASLSEETDRYTSIATEEVLTPEQFFPSAKDSAIEWSGERKLLLAVLRDAIDSFFRYMRDSTTRGKRLFRETHDWFWSTDRQWLCSFENICDHLHMDADYIRGGLKRYYDPLAFSAMPLPVQRRRTRRVNSHLTVVGEGKVAA